MNYNQVPSEEKNEDQAILCCKFPYTSVLCFLFSVLLASFLASGKAKVAS